MYANVCEDVFSAYRVLDICLKMGFLLHTIMGAVRSSRRGYSAKVWHWNILIPGHFLYKIGVS